MREYRAEDAAGARGCRASTTPAAPRRTPASGCRWPASRPLRSPSRSAPGTAGRSLRSGHPEEDTWPVSFETVTSVISPIDPNRACARGFDRATLEGPAVVAAPGQCAVHTDMSPGGRDRTQYQRKEVEWVFHR